VDENDAAFYSSVRENRENNTRSRNRGRNFGQDRCKLTYEQCVEIKLTNCFGCAGYGHVKNQCPNLPGVKVSAGVAFKLLLDGQKRAASNGPGSSSRPSPRPS